MWSLVHALTADCSSWHKVVVCGTDRHMWSSVLAHSAWYNVNHGGTDYCMVICCTERSRRLVHCGHWCYRVLVCYSNVCGLARFRVRSVPPDRLSIGGCRGKEIRMRWVDGTNLHAVNDRFRLEKGRPRLPSPNLTRPTSIQQSTSSRSGLRAA